MSAKPNLPASIGAVDWAGPECHEAIISGLVHCIRLPDRASLKQPVPVVVMLHGWGGDETSMWLFKRVPPANVAIVTPPRTARFGW